MSKTIGALDNDKNIHTSITMSRINKVGIYKNTKLSKLTIIIKMVKLIRPISPMRK
jgi:hypothetical protein